MTLAESLRRREIEAQHDRVEIRTYYSRSLSAEQKYVLLRPASVATAAPADFPLLMLLHGAGGSCMDWLEQTRIASATAGLALYVVMASGAAGWYTNAFDGSLRHEDDLLCDLTNHLLSTLPVAPGKLPWAIGGISMGGYGAVKLALKRPDLFRVAFSHSGAFGITRSAIADRVFGDPKSESGFRMREDVAWLTEQAMSAFPLERPMLLLDCGLNDPIVDQSREFASHLQFLGYPHSYREAPGYHSWPYWDRALRRALPEALALISRS
jgi:S-formylglutathione hydrolase FrmB